MSRIDLGYWQSYLRLEMLIKRSNRTRRATQILVHEHPAIRYLFQL